MVFPLHDNIRRRRRPYVTWGLIAVNLLVFLAEVAADQAVYDLLDLFAVVPTQTLALRAWLATGGWPLVTLVTSTFFHGSWMHLLGNMLYLWVFGDNVEDLLGHGRYILFYLLCGILANLAHIFANPTSAVPTIGASGAVAGVLGAYLLSFPGARVLTLFHLGIIIPAVPVRAWLFLALWFLMQLFSGLTPIWAAEVTQTVAFWAHISGFLSGFALVRLLRPEPKAPLAGR
ncbi:MAG TPA: rhomboid family intramembrane serine protease [Symbiobacteriaceae bacterium]|nr:rhomboid family intramembrane serine protease [Symbiobacteriaceae bacterium]